MTLGEFRKFTEDLSDDTNIVIHCHDKVDIVDELVNVSIENREKFREICPPLIKSVDDYEPIADVWSEKVIYINKHFGCEQLYICNNELDIN